MVHAPNQATLELTERLAVIQNLSIAPTISWWPRRVDPAARAEQAAAGPRAHYPRPAVPAGSLRAVLRPPTLLEQAIRLPDSRLQVAGRRVDMF
jgi:hypothetical protein